MKSSELVSNVFNSILPFAVKNNIDLVQMVKLMDLAITNLKVEAEDTKLYLDTIALLNNLALALRIPESLEANAFFYNEAGLDRLRKDNTRLVEFKKKKADMYNDKDPKTVSLLAEWMEKLKAPPQEGDTYNVHKT